MAVLTVVKIGRGFRITLPKEVREILQVTEENELIFFTIEGQKSRVCIRRS
jgi:AbrB family looped-hinge helix DNA binding protein